MSTPVNGSRDPNPRDRDYSRDREPTQPGGPLDASAADAPLDDDPFVVSHIGRPNMQDAGIMDGGTILGPAERRAMRRRSTANPDDPFVRRPPEDSRGPRPGPDFRGAPGRLAIVQGQIYLVGAILLAQLFLITTSLYELLTGEIGRLWWICGACFVGFLITLLIALWPRSRVKGF